MQTRKIGDVEVHECATCKGTWFERGELQKAKDQTDRDLNWIDFDLWKHKDRFRAEAKPLPCPACNVGMVLIEYGQTGVDIHYCAKCEGIWLEAGQFEKIIDALVEELDTKSASEYAKASLQEAKEIVTGREGFVSEWQDFLTVLRMLEYRILVDNPGMKKMIENIQKIIPIR
jgi:Zn-finger nucleic acid-binding protein